MASQHHDAFPDRGLSRVPASSIAKAIKLQQHFVSPLTMMEISYR